MVVACNVMSLTGDDHILYNVEYAGKYKIHILLKELSMNGDCPTHNSS